MFCRQDSGESTTAEPPVPSHEPDRDNYHQLQQMQQSNASSKKSLEPDKPESRASSRRKTTGRSEELTIRDGSSQPPSLMSSKASASSDPPSLESKKSSKLPDRDEFNQLRRSIKELAEEFETEIRQIKSMLQESLGVTAEDQAASVAREKALSVIAEDELTDAMTLLGNSLEYLVRGARQEKMDLLSVLRKSMNSDWTGEAKTEQLTVQPPAQSSTASYPSSSEMSELLRHINMLAAELRSQNERISQTFQSRSVASLSAPGEFEPEPAPLSEQLPLTSPFYGLQQGIVSLTKRIQEDNERLSSLLQPTAPRHTTDPSEAVDITFGASFGSPLQQEVMATGRSVMSKLHELSSMYTEKAGGEEAVVASTPLIEAIREVTTYVETLARNIHDLKQRKSNERRAHYAQGMRQALEELTSLVHDLSGGLGGLEQTRFQECIEQQQELVARLTIPDPALLQVLQQVNDSVRRLSTGVMEMRERQDQLLDKYSHPVSLPFELGLSRTLASNGEHPNSVLMDVHGVEEEAMLKSLRDLRESVTYIGREMQEAELKKPRPPPKVPEVPPTDPNVLKALSALRQSVKSIHRRRNNISSSSSSSSDTLHIR
uniref:Uncharacterized protein n=1 Tax=Schistocephalus solidus TaxID=70667 RepID=A0A0X3Q4A1_SCHSO